MWSQSYAQLLDELRRSQVRESLATEALKALQELPAFGNQRQIIGDALAAMERVT